MSCDNITIKPRPITVPKDYVGAPIDNCCNTTTSTTTTTTSED